MVKVEGLTKKYGSQIAVDHINFIAKPGEVLGFLGPNGAGKSTTMKMITSYLPQDEGIVTICGIDTTVDSLESRKHIGYLPEHNPLYIDMYVKEYLRFAATIHKVNDPVKAINNAIEITGLGKEQHKLIGALSKGFKQRVGLAQALLHDPAVLILDEPTSGLDMNQLVDIRALIKDLGKTKTVIFSTHIMQEVQVLCDRVVIINEGIIVADDPIEELQNRIKGENLIMLTLLDNNFDVNSFSQIDSVLKIERNDSTLKIYTDASIDIRPDLFRLCASSNWVIIEMSLQKLSVEYIFQKLTKTTAHA
jgi:ABC-2 type transport system ATP-binding protein